MLQQQNKMNSEGFKGTVCIHILSGRVAAQWGLKATKRSHGISKFSPSKVLSVCLQTKGRSWPRRKSRQTCKHKFQPKATPNSNQNFIKRHPSKSNKSLGYIVHHILDYNVLKCLIPSKRIEKKTNTNSATESSKVILVLLK